MINVFVVTALLLARSALGDVAILEDPAGDKVIGAAANFGASVPSIEGTVGAVSPWDACSTLQSSASGATFLMAQRGNCTFAEKVRRMQDAGAKVALIVNYDDSAVVMTGNSSEIAGITIPAVMIGAADGKQILSTIQSNPDAVFSIHTYARSYFDGSIVFLLIIAVITVAAGAFWSSAPERASAYSLPQYRDPDIPEEEIAYLTPGAAIGFVVFASLGLVLMFYFINKLIYFLFFIFGMGGASSLLLALSPLVRKLSPHLRTAVQLPYLGNVEKTVFILFFPCYGLALWWFFVRNSSYSWVLQDILGISLLLAIQRTLRLPNIKVSTILLVLAFFYDIFWVFISPYIFQQSVMVTVATGGDTGEAIPMLIRFPRLNDELGGYSLLGLGDIALPGLFISYVLRYDYKKKLKGFSGYFPVVLAGYTIGLIFTDIALVVYKVGQPALLYLVPCTIGVVCLLAWRKGDLHELWNGGAETQDNGNHVRLEEEEEDYIRTRSPS